MNMYKNLGQPTKRVFTGNEIADCLILDLFEEKSANNRNSLKKILWNDFKKTLR
ncbi:hypothetical protein IZY60_02685 [Lutibacter sp. B2]|nr:hypothetical protein [Lutibacter sp. B2]